MLNGINSCFAAAAVSFLSGLELDLNLDATAVRDPRHQAPEALFVQQAANLGNPAVVPFSPVPLQQAYNQCVAPNLAFPPGQADCAMEFLRGQVPPGGLLYHLQAAPGFFTTFTEQGICGVCRQQSQQVSLWDSCRLQYALSRPSLARCCPCLYLLVPAGQALCQWTSTPSTWLPLLFHSSPACGVRQLALRRSSRPT